MNTQKIRKRRQPEEKHEDATIDYAISQIYDLCAEVEKLQTEIENLISGHFCPSPQLSKFSTTCNCAHSDRHRAMDWASIDKLQAELDKLQILKDTPND